MKKKIVKIMKNNNMSTDLTLPKEISPMVKQAKALTITNDETLSLATSQLSSLNIMADKVKAEKEKVTKPINEALRAERARWKPLEDELGEAIDYIRKTMGAYQTALMKKRREDEERIAKRVEKGTLKVETAINKLANIEAPTQKVATDNGSLAFRTDYKLVIKKPLAIPREFLVPNEAKILQALKAKVAVEGCTLEEIQVPVNRRK